MPKNRGFVGLEHSTHTVPITGAMPWARLNLLGPLSSHLRIQKGGPCGLLAWSWVSLWCQQLKGSMRMGVEDGGAFKEGISGSWAEPSRQCPSSGISSEDGIELSSFALSYSGLEDLDEGAPAIWGLHLSDGSPSPPGILLAGSLEIL